jgi:hypothetical protein
MSAKRKKYAGQDNYETPEWVVDALFKHLAVVIPKPKVVLEPCAGRGAVIKVIQRYYPEANFIGVEPDASRCAKLRDLENTCVRESSFEACLAQDPSLNPDLVITNPPYSQSNKLVPLFVNAFPHATVAILLRLNWLGAAKRKEFHQSNPAQILILPQRPSFDGVGTDATEYAWYLYNKYAKAGQWQMLDTDKPRKARCSSGVKV